MARLGSSPLSYGHDHHDEHVRAAKLGWLRRRRGASFAGSREQSLLSRVVGEVQHAHEHPDHRGIVAFKQRGKWYELPRGEFRRLVSVGRGIEADEKREAAHRRAEERAIAEFRKAEEQERRQAEVNRKREQRHRDAQDRMVRARDRAERSEVVKLLREVGGIRLATKADRGEYQLLPSEIRRKNGRVTIDEARARVVEHMPWLNLDTPDDLVQFFERSRVKTMHEAMHAKRRRAA